MEQDRRERTSNSKIKELWIWRPEEFTEVESFFFQFGRELPGHNIKALSRSTKNSSGHSPQVSIARSIYMQKVM
jgi:hypothetical protein